jgi:hypothetical protein
MYSPDPLGSSGSPLSAQEVVQAMLSKLPLSAKQQTLPSGQSVVLSHQPVMLPSEPGLQALVNDSGGPSMKEKLQQAVAETS